MTYYTHETCEDAYDGEGYCPACKPCLDVLGKMDFYSKRR